MEALWEAALLVHGKTGNQYNFQFSYLDTTNRRKMRDFMDWIPDGVIGYCTFNEWQSVYANCSYMES